VADEICEGVQMTLKEDVFPKLRQLHYLVSESEGKHVAQCLDLDIVATGTDIPNSVRRLDTLVKAHIEGSLMTGNYSNLATPSPKNYWDSYNAGEEIVLENHQTLEIRLPEIVPMNKPESSLGITARQLAHAA